MSQGIYEKKTNLLHRQTEMFNALNKNFRHLFHSIGKYCAMHRQHPIDRLVGWLVAV